MAIDPAKFTKHASGQVAVRLLDMAFNDRNVGEAFDRFVAPPYRQHNPQVPDGIEGALAGIPHLLAAMPGLRYDVKRVLVDGDLVAVHSHITNGAGDRGTAAVDIFRVVNGKAVEHWDVLQPVPETAANGNTMF
ncbi:MAG: nuclear transport factor 2 family protein [Bauldia sp.]|nr:nuclear transport factor 2 family protein [Bauldia sp.]